jgi:hypothetical protein
MQDRRNIGIALVSCMNLPRLTLKEIPWSFKRIPLGKFNALSQRGTMATETLRYSKRRWTIYGTIGGIVGGIVMLIPMMAMMSMLGLPSDLFQTLVGMMTGQ